MHLDEATAAIARKIDDIKTMSQQMYQDADSARSELSTLRKQYGKLPAWWWLGASRFQA